ncbi:protein of unknown function [Moritella yayanosii]|uniref:Uncharacterized protein n=1 Tax=Moritella yayanosii TaxID=69539 RepID=A0A330LL59_9GAMM|nr:protein of unknown function [Moritella yayanosii]
MLANVNTRLNILFNKPRCHFHSRTSAYTWANIGYSTNYTSHSLTVCVDIKQCANFIELVNVNH